MTIKERKILDKEIQYLCENFIDRVGAIRDYTGINPAYTILKEVETIESLYEDVLAYRKDDKFKSNYFSCGTSGWYVQYFRDKKKYKKGEKFNIKIFHSFVYS